MSSLSITTRSIEPRDTFCYFCEQWATLTHHSFVQNIDVCTPCAKALAQAENELRDAGFTRPVEGQNAKEPWDNFGTNDEQIDPKAGEEWKGDEPNAPGCEGGPLA